MKQRVGLFALCLAVVLGAAPIALAQESRPAASQPTTKPAKMEESTSRPAPPEMGAAEEAAADPMAMMEQMMADYKVPEPGPEHQAIALSVGQWDAVVTLRMTPEAPPMQTTATEKNEMMGPFWMKTEFAMDFMGQEMHGAGLLGFDTKKGELVTIWIDSTSPVPAIMSGQVDAATGTMSFEGQMYDPMLDDDVPVRMVEERVDADHRVTRMFVRDQDGREFVTMQMEYTRKK